MFLTEPIVPPDIKLLSNEGKAFWFHKNVLKKISPVFKNMLEGDLTAEKIPLPDISTEMLELLQYFVYCDPKKRCPKESKKDNGGVFKNCRCLRMFYEYPSVHILISKYNIKIIENLAEKLYGFTVILVSIFLLRVIK